MREEIRKLRRQVPKRLAAIRRVSWRQIANLSLRRTLKALRRQRRAVWFAAASSGRVEISLMTLSETL